MQACNKGRLGKPTWAQGAKLGQQGAIGKHLGKPTLAQVAGGQAGGNGNGKAGQTHLGTGSKAVGKAGGNAELQEHLESLGILGTWAKLGATLGAMGTIGILGRHRKTW